MSARQVNHSQFPLLFPFINNRSLDWLDALYNSIPQDHHTDYFKDKVLTRNDKNVVINEFEHLLNACEEDFISAGFKPGDILAAEWDFNKFAVIVVTRLGNFCIFDHHKQLFIVCGMSLGGVVGHFENDEHSFRSNAIRVLGVCVGPYTPTNVQEVNNYPFTNNIGFRIEALLDTVGLI